MILADTNLVSEILRSEPDQRVVGWFDSQEGLGLAAPVLAELLLGVSLMPDGVRKNRLGAALRLVLRLRFPEHAVPFDTKAAEIYAEIISRTRRAGRSVAIIDGQIAAIALSRGCAVATRDTAPFEAAGVAVINPWLSA